jgi:glycosyltransferase 2 family protein
LLLVLATYVVALWWLDRDNHVLAHLKGMAASLGLATFPVLLSYALRYQRWRGLSRSDRPPYPWWQGFAAYVAGFSLTASPGKAGELLRIRYFSRLGMPPHRTLAAFVCERSLDLLVITGLAACAASMSAFFGWAVVVVLVTFAVLVALAATRSLHQRALTLATSLSGKNLSRLAVFITEGAVSLRLLSSPRAWMEGTLFGLCAWLLTSSAFIWLCLSLSIALPWPAALGIYPLAMLLGALSFMPGGIGATEAVIVMVLRQYGTPLELAIAAAIGIRLASLWLAVATGLLSVILLETFGRDGAVPTSSA